MNRTVRRAGKTPAFPRAWREAEYDALRFIAADTCDDRVSDSIFDADDERAEVDLAIQRMGRDPN